MSDVIDAIATLRGCAEELARLSQSLHQVEAQLEETQADYDQFINDFEVGTWLKHESEGAKLPPAAMRTRLAHNQMDPVLLGRYVGLTRKRDQLIRDIGIEKTKAEAQRSILSALKTELEASR